MKPDPITGRKGHPSKKTYSESQPGPYSTRQASDPTPPTRRRARAARATDYRPPTTATSPPTTTYRDTPAAARHSGWHSGWHHPGPGSTPGPHHWQGDRNRPRTGSLTRRYTDCGPARGTARRVAGSGTWVTGTSDWQGNLNQSPKHQR